MRHAFLSLLVSVLVSSAGAQRMSYAVGAEGHSAIAMQAEHSDILPGEAFTIIRRQDLWLVPGIAGRDTGLFLLDTGAPGLILHREAGMGLADGAVAGATGEVAVTHTDVDVLRIANLVQRNVPALAIDLSAARGLLGDDLVGIIGYGQFRAASAHVDFRRRTLRFGASPTAAATARVYDFDFQSHLPTVRIGVGDGAYALAFDTGSEVNVFDDALLPELNESLRGRPAYKDISGVDANVERAPYALVRLALLEDDRYSNRPFAFLDLGGLRQNLPALDGVLGVDFWGADAIVIDYLNQRITTLDAP